MPVTDLRYLIEPPQEAPQNPVFQRTRQLAGMPQSPYESALAFERAAPMVQAGQGTAYLQQIQNHQNEIAQQAQNLRMQQEAQLAAEQATRGLAGVNPQSAQYAQQRQQLLQQSPDALLDPRFRNALQVYDQGYSQFDRQRQLQANQQAAQQKQAQSLGLRAIEYGASPDAVAEHVANGNVGALAQIAGEARRAGLAKPKGADSTDYRTKEAYQAYLKAIADDSPDAAAAIDKFARDGGFHWQTTPPAGEQNPAANASPSAATPAPSAATSPPQQALAEESDFANVPFSQIGKVVAQKKAENEEIHNVNQAWSRAKTELEDRIKSVIPDAPFEGTKVNQLERFAKAVMDGETVSDPTLSTGVMGSEGDILEVPIWQPVLSQLGLKGEAFRNPDAAILSKTSVPYDDLIKAWAQDYLNRKGKLLPTKESPTGSVLTPEQEAAFKKLESKINGK